VETDAALRLPMRSGPPAIPSLRERNCANWGGTRGIAPGRVSARDGHRNRSALQRRAADAEERTVSEPVLDVLSMKRAGDGSGTKYSPTHISHLGCPSLLRTRSTHPCTLRGSTRQALPRGCRALRRSRHGWSSRALLVCLYHDRGRDTEQVRKSAHLRVSSS
jgi:hypothetical protein